MKRDNQFYEDPIDQWFDDAMLADEEAEEDEEASLV